MFEVVKFYVPTCLVLAEALSYTYITAGNLLTWAWGEAEEKCQ